MDRSASDGERRHAAHRGGSVLIAAAGVLAGRHIRTNRADRRGAWRVTAYLSIAGMLSWVLRASHSSSLEGEISLFFREAGTLAFLGAIFWTISVAVESYVRRLWPDALLGWSRLLTGHIRDPRVGRDLLIGMVFGVALILIDMATATLLPLLGLSASFRATVSARRCLATALRRSGGR